MKPYITHHETMMKYLAKPTEAVSYLNCVAEDGDVFFLLKALRKVVEAQGGIAALAKKTKLSRTSLYKTLSENGNPEIGTLEKILAVYGIQISFTKAKPRHRKAA